MAKKKTLRGDNIPSIYTFNTVEENGKAPESRISTCNDAWTLADNLRRDNSGREAKWGRLYRCYKMFPPTDYSEVAKKGLTGLSNVPFGQMQFIIDNQKSSFYDMVTERGLASTIVTKKGNAKEKKEWSELISIAWDRTFRGWHSCLYNTEIDQEEMLLYGKGIEFRESKDGWFTRSLHNYEVLIPDRTYADLTNLGECVLKRSYTPLEFWHKISGGETDADKAHKHAKELGYNFYACVDAMRIWVGNPEYHLTNVQFLTDIASGNVNLSKFYNIKIDVFELLIKEFDGTISKMGVLQTYMPLRNKWSKVYQGRTDEQYREEAGFLFYKKKWAETWDDIIYPMTDSTGSGFWHEIKSLAERVFVQCRQYDLNMNRAMDALNVNNMLLLKGGSADATKKIKQMEWLPMCVLPEDVEPQQVRMSLPVMETFQAMQYYMGDMYRGIGAYRINAPTNEGGQRTKGEAELDAAESAKLTGTQIKRYNECQTNWQKGLYKAMVNTTAGGDGYDLKQKFEEFLQDNGVPKEAWQWENIEHMESNMLSGAGSPSFKLMASERTIALAGMTAANEGQEEAIRDGIAALQGRQNVDRYRPRKPQDIPDQVRVIAFENSTLDNPLANPENARVMDTDNHIEHIRGHFSDAMVLCDQLEKMIQSGATDGKPIMDGHVALMLKGGHIMAHMGYLAKDESKKNEMDQFKQAMQQLQGRADNIGKIGQQMMEAQQPKQQSEEQIKLEAKVAESALKIEEMQKKADIKLASIAQQHEIRQQITKDKAATSLAVTRAKATQDMQLKQNEKSGSDKESGS